MLFFGLDLITLVIGFAAGGVVCVMVPKVFAWFTKQVASGQKAANTIISGAQTVAKEVQNTASKL